MPCCLLSNRSVIAVKGADARTWLQGLVTIDALKLTPDAPRYGMLLSPQGKYLFDFFMLAQPDALWLECARADALMAALKRYRLRAAVEIAPVEGLRVFACWNGVAPKNAFPDPRLPALGHRLTAEQAPEGSAAGEAEYDAHRLSLGVPDGEKDLTIDRSLPLEWGLDALHAVDFDKGCYIGQEVTARMRFRATIRKRPFIVTADKTLPAPGTKVMCGEREAGELRSSEGNTGLALINTEAMTGPEITAQGVKLHAASPAWLESAG